MIDPAETFGPSDDAEFLAVWRSMEASTCFTTAEQVGLVHLGWLMARADAEEALAPLSGPPSTPVR